MTGDTNNQSDVFVHDCQTGEATRVSVSTTGVEGDDTSRTPAISTDGRFVAFYASATNLVTGNTNNSDDVFIHDRLAGQTSRVSVSSTGVEGNDDSTKHTISGDGRFVAFESLATNFVTGDNNNKKDVFVHDFRAFTYLPMIIQ